MVSATNLSKERNPRRERGGSAALAVQMPSYLYALLGVTLVTVALYLARPWLQWSEIALLYLPLIIGYSTRFGFGPAVFGAVMSFFCCDYFFLPPYYTFLVNSAQGWLSLSVFLFAAIVTARLASRARDEAMAAEAREREATMLYEASQAVSTEVDALRLLPTLAGEVVRISGATECSVLRYVPEDHSLTVAGYASTDDYPQASGRTVAAVALAVLEWGDKAREGGLALPPDTEPSSGIYVPLHVQSSPMGVLFASYPADGLPFTEQGERFIRTLASHAAVVIARQRLREESEAQSRHIAVVEERDRLTRDVHDALSHTFTGIKFLLEAADKVGPTPEAIECIAEARKLAVEGAQEARRSVLALRPAPLEEAGDLAAAIRTLVRRHSAAFDIDFEITGEPFPLPAKVEENLLRVCQESTSNALRHAEAEQVTIGLRFEAGWVTLSIKDDGVGFDPESLPPGSGFGLTSMRQRSTILGAELRVTSTIDEGTEISIRTPIERFGPDNDDKGHS